MKDQGKKTPRMALAAATIVSVVFVAFVVICTTIAYNVLSSMSDIRIERNEPFPEKYASVLEEIEVRNKDGLAIRAYLLAHENSKGNVLILHGMHGMDASSLFGYAEFIYKAGYTPICIDMRAHGKSDGEKISFGYHEPLDVAAVIEWLKNEQRFSENPIILYGLSMGASTAINTAALSQHVDGVIAVSAFSSIQDQVSDYMIRDGAPKTFVKIFRPFVNLALKMKFGVSPVSDSPLERIRQIGDIPVLIIHGDMDTQTHVSHAEKLYENSGSSKNALWIVQGKGHLITPDITDADSDSYKEKIIEFLTEYF